MLYEIRVYEAADGRAEAMRDRFLAHVVPRLPRHGIELVGVFAATEEDGRLTYMTRFADEAARRAGWASFQSDQEWLAIKAQSEVDGPLLKQQSVSILTPAHPGLPLG